MGVDDCNRGSDESGLDGIQRYVSRVLAGGYHVQVARGVDPTWLGYPIRWPRVFRIELRIDVCDPASASRPLAAILSEPFARSCNCLTFLGESAVLDWSKVVELQSVDDLRELSELPLAAWTCCGNPMVLGSVHPCGCGGCGPDGLECK